MIVTDGVTLEVVVIVGVGVIVTDGVTLGVFDGVAVTDGVAVGVGETNEASQQILFENTLLFVAALWLPPIKIYRFAVPNVSLLQL